MAAVTAYFLHMLVWALPFEVHLAVEYDHNVHQGTENVDLECFDGGPLVDLYMAVLVFENFPVVRMEV